MDRIKIRRVCILDTEYSLLLYLLISSLSDINETLFIYSDRIKNVVTKFRFKEYIFLNPSERIDLIKEYFRIKKMLNKYDITQATFWGHDHYVFTSTIIGNNKINVIEDGLANYINNPYTNKTWKRRFFMWLIGSKIRKDYFGVGKHCDHIIATNLVAEIENPVIKSKAIQYNTENLWLNSSLEKQNYLLSVFDLQANDINQARTKNIVLLTQPTLGGCSVDDWIDMYRKVLKQYNNDEILIKVHAGDKIKYEKYFKDCLILYKRFPFELFYLVGKKFRTAITYNSSAIFSIPYNLEKIIIDPKYK